MRIQTRLEEKLNASIHAFGALLGVLALILLPVFNSNKTGNSLFSVVVYALTIIILFTASTLYHSVILNDNRKRFFRVIDHISIYFLIAGTYTPIALISLKDSLGCVLFWVVWCTAAFGVILKLFFTGKFELFSTILYLVMGWLIVFDFPYLYEIVGSYGILLLFAGGLCYTLGIVFYAIESIPFNHVIWHVFVLFGAIFHFLMIFCYVI